MPFQDESITVETPNGKFANQMSSGRAMLPRFAGEKPLYDTATEADAAAGMRSTYEYDELRRDPNNEWYAAGTPAPPLLDVPGQSMHQAPAIGKKASMVDPNQILDTISSGLKSINMDNLMKGNFNANAHAAKVMSTGPGADAQVRQSAWISKPGEAPFLTPEASEMTPRPMFGDTPQGNTSLQPITAHETSGAVMGAPGTQYDKNAKPILVAGMSHEDQLGHAMNGTTPNAAADSQAALQQLNNQNPSVGKQPFGDRYTGKVDPNMSTWQQNNNALIQPEKKKSGAQILQEAADAEKARAAERMRKLTGG